MGDLRDQLKKAKLLSDKEAKRLAHEERVKRKDVGREGLEREQAARQQELAGLREQDREDDRRRQAELERDRQDRAERAACEEIVRAARVPGRGGQIRFFFETEDGRLPWLSVSESERLELGSGMVAIVRRGPEGADVYGLLETSLAKRVRKSLPERVAWAARGVLR
jgi:uncharacterized protein YaiL (DUF2058 family)